MSNDFVWRYMSLARYVDLLRSRALFLPKASLFTDETEGKWVAHAYLWGRRQHLRETRVHVDALQTLLSKASGDPGRMLQEAKIAYGQLSEPERKGVLGDVLGGLILVHAHLREEHLKGFVKSWTKIHDNYNAEVQEYASQVAINRESTYVSCWSRADSMSAAMWSVYGGNEAVAVRSSISKLRALLQSASARLQELGLGGELVDVWYVDRLKEPEEDLQYDLLERLSVGNNVRVGEFSVKSSLYAYEEEVRIVLYNKRGLFERVTNPHPDWHGVSLPIEEIQDRGPGPLRALSTRCM